MCDTVRHARDRGTGICKYIKYWDDRKIFLTGRRNIAMLFLLMSIQNKIFTA
jgi:hypothetical protein